ncbi:hypothetical protein BABINDRAFT_5228 [Babjeviella inositovora NRRL Y-12698]|uniref:Domain of unknown function at the cortex 1 domain-containing protein n=1 Tax=Babjeviella inositovora NRRL Y-12698 TaxID=984486 RepID=A0A1E3QX03_9ASCO|nr:uncharacterized protein BABINDRAFT_5228 [Babjeviella inositovora NRRL Y-12698]ODQ82229.1 hypothetical protein BABINDRAFT_5228 [Babjeviella inositovora NRRL Y-12698]
MPTPDDPILSTPSVEGVETLHTAHVDAKSDVTLDGTLKRLRISAASSYESDAYEFIPVNSNKPVVFVTQIGRFEVFVNIRHFQGMPEHDNGSVYNKADLSEEEIAKQPNLEIIVHFTPSAPLSGDQLLFGNDFTYSIKPYIPTTLLTAGLKFFSWFIDASTQGDVTSDKPYIYGSALSSFNKIDYADINKETKTTGSRIDTENLHELSTHDLKIPEAPSKRSKFFAQQKHQAHFSYEKDMTYEFEFNTNFIKLQDSQFAVSIPMYGSRTFDVNVLDYLNDTFNNVNFVVKAKSKDGVYDVGTGNLGVVIKFELL